MHKQWNKKKRRENNEKKKLHLLGWDYSEKTLLERNPQERKLEEKMGFAKDKERNSYSWIEIF